MKKISALLMLVLALLALDLSAQSRQISGIVTGSADHQPIIGATVIIAGTANGAITDLDGRYTINNANGQVTLSVSFMGFKTATSEVAMSATTHNFVLEVDALSLDEVVVVGLGISRDKKALGYSVQNLESEDLTTAGSTNIVTSLQGKVSGIEIKPSSGMPGASSQIVIRGARSFTGNNQPLYVIDGMPISSASDIGTSDSVSGTDFSNRSIDIDPNDIESMNILKGQAASALYGIRASNGVIIITTKSGKKNGNGRVNVSFSNSTSFDVISRLPDMQTTYAQGSGGVYNPNSSMNWGPKISDLPSIPNIYNDKGVITSAYGGDLNNNPGKYYVPQLATAGLDPWQTPRSYNNVEDFFQTGFTTNTAANVSKSVDGFSYYLGLSNTVQEGIIPNTGMDRSGVRMNAETKLGKSWRTGFSGSYNQTSLNKAPSANDAILATVYGAPASYDINGYPSQNPQDPYSQISYRSATFNNPYWGMEHNTYSEKTSRFYGNTFLEFAPDYDWSHNQNIVVKYQLGVDSYSTNYDTILEYGHKGNKGEISNQVYSNNTFNSLLTATYNIDVTTDFKINFLAGNELNHSNMRNVFVAGKNLNYGGWAHIDNTTTQWGGNSQDQDRTVGFFGNLNLSYKSLLFLGVTAREDMVSIMPRNNRSFFYPSVSLGYVFSEHKLFETSDILNFGKLRFSYAEVGQASKYYNNFYDKPSYGGGFWSYAPITYPTNGTTSYTPYPVIYDENLKPQNTISYETGIDLVLFNHILEVNYTFSRQNVKDQIFGVPLAGSTGYSQRIMNGGRIHTNTHEVYANVNLITKSDWDWDVNVNFTKMGNYVDELAEGVESIFLGGFVTPQVRAGKGDQFPVIYGGTFQRDDQGRILVDENEFLADGKRNAKYGMPMSGAPDVIGKVSPNFNLGFGTTISWKDIQLRATFDYKNGGQMYSGTNGLMNLYGTSAASGNREEAIIYDGYLASGEKSNILIQPEYLETLYTSALDVDEAYIYDNDYLKLREINLQYKIKTYKTFTIGLNVFARNILLWSKLPNLDPESTQGNTNMGGAFERFSLPQTSSYGFGVNLTF